MHGVDVQRDLLIVQCKDGNVLVDGIAVDIANEGEALDNKADVYGVGARVRAEGVVHRSEFLQPQIRHTVSIKSQNLRYDDSTSDARTV